MEHTHELNKMLAKFVGMRWGYCLETNQHGYFDIDGQHFPNWDPCHDHTQMALVEEQLRKGFDDKYHYHYIIQWHWDCKQHNVVIYKIWLTKFGCDQTFYDRYHESKLMAFALAVEAMLKETKRPCHKLGPQSK